MKKAACISIGLVIFICCFTDFAWSIKISLNIQKGEKITKTYVKHGVSCADYQYYYQKIVGKPSSITYDTISVIYRESSIFPTCQIDIKYSIQALPGVSSGVYPFTVHYIVYDSLNDHSFDFDFTIGIDVPDINITPKSFSMLNVEKSFNSPGPTPEGLAFDGTYLWNSDTVNDKIYKLDTSGKIVSSFNSPSVFPGGLAFDGTYIWNADFVYATIYKMDTSGKVITSFEFVGTSPEGLAFDGTYLWTVDSWDERIYKLTTSGEVVASFDSPTGVPGGLAFDGNHLWLSDWGDKRIYKIDTSGNIITVFDVPFISLEGLTFQGVHLWIADSYEGSINRLAIPYVGTTMHQTYTAKNNGISPLQISSVMVKGSNAAEFSIQNDTCSNQSLTSSETCTFDAVFSPTKEGEKSATIEITSNDPDTPILSIPINGRAEINTRLEMVKAFVTRFYQLCLSRDPDPAGLYNWITALLEYTLTGSDVAYGFVFSPEFLGKNTSDEDYLKVLYEAFFNRDPDPSGWDGWIAALKSGSSREEVLNGFIYATEFANLCEKYGILAFEDKSPKNPKEYIEAFVTRFYQLCLDRNPDPMGLETWTNNLLNQIQTGADVAHGFIDSKEFLEKNTTNEEYLTILYKAFFNRDPDSAGFSTWLAELNAGKDRGYVLDGFLYSQEFSELCKAYGINPY